MRDKTALVDRAPYHLRRMAEARRLQARGESGIERHDSLYYAELFEAVAEFIDDARSKSP